MSIPAIIWTRSQPKELENRLKNFNWLVLHKRLPVRETLYNHKLTNSKTCPRDQCNTGETITHVLWECQFAQTMWEKLKEHFPCLKNVHYSDIVSFQLKNVKKKRLPIVSLITVAKLKLWEARCNFIKETCIRSETLLVYWIKQEIKKMYNLEVLKWGETSIKTKWKIIKR